MESVKRFLYACDHEGFLKLTLETFQNRWLPSQINLTHDVKCLQLLNQRDTEFYKFLFTFLGMAECLVNLNIDELLAHFNGHDVKHYYAEQVAMENIHAKTYANILNVFFKNNVGETYRYAEDIMNDEALVKKINWLREYVKTAEKRSEKVLLFLLVEGIFFISSFYSIGLLRPRGLMNGVCLANDYISRDEMLHTRAAALLYNTMVPEEEKPSLAWIYQLFNEAVEVEYNFIRAKGEGVTMVDINDIKTFLMATADRILQSINVKPLYGVSPPPSCPLTYVGSIKNINFFERENTDYSALVTDDL
ncbi:ribonucleotide reductase subunit 2 [Common bottlenose dolphin gammaherpesvirus 1 strain Sarasota]|uniref:ribonucleoside-diphosphate reductase n=1 Tax=Common bottlenose dolphin gammaherpesvirus 1 strain Sarasota TaxID=2022783 RepID=A0A1Z1NEH7_9GAMA|nr:ribonucleotide reductase subunit 2 [Common bottlenose dolphin gammaherpesvirus 1 strain Sarasota]ARW78122.1 ribonucleotide reductase subunit 2 [Common bottlenose dolphin gammaherpesvirus 1 strain Sarasota]